MTTEQKRIKIAEACGYAFIDEGWRYPNEPDWQKYKAVYRGSGFVGLAKPSWIPIPDYFNDLNATHEMEKTMTREQQTKHMDFLINQNSELSDMLREIAFATAAQRAEAFGLTLGLWKEGE